MERRTFIHRSALAAAGAILTPVFYGKLLAAPPGAVFHLPSPVDHVRHGLVGHDFRHYPGLPPWLQWGVPHRMFRNGISSGPDDMLSLALRLGSHPLSITRLRGRHHLRSAGGAQVLAEKPLLVEPGEGCRVEYHPVGKGGAIEVKHGAVLFVLEGRVEAGGVVLPASAGMAADRDVRVTAGRGEMPSALLVLLRH